ncbi:hypothetical protein LXL04_013627 [Taraxacum kok-saghyz]
MTTTCNQGVDKASKTEGSSLVPTSPPRPHLRRDLRSAPTTRLPATRLFPATRDPWKLQMNREEEIRVEFVADGAEERRLPEMLGVGLLFGADSNSGRLHGSELLNLVSLGN